MLCLLDNGISIMNHWILKSQVGIVGSSDVLLSKWSWVTDPDLLQNINFFIYINTNEIPGELSTKTWYLHMWERLPFLWLHNKSCLSKQKAIKVEWFGISLVFIQWIKHYMATWRYEISLLMSKNILLVCCAHSLNIIHYSNVLEEIFHIATWPCNILYLFTWDITDKTPNTAIKVATSSEVKCITCKTKWKKMGLVMKNKNQSKSI